MREVFGLFLCFFSLSFLMSCSQEYEVKKEIAAIELNLKIERFDSIFAHSKPDDLQRLRNEYPFMFSTQFTDQDYINRMEDSLQQELHAEVERVFTNFPEIDEIELFFKHLSYNFPAFKMPRLISVTSDVDYRNRVIVTDTIALIALDNYLGPEHRYYKGLQRYIAADQKRDLMVSDLAESYARKIIPMTKSKIFLDDLIYHGKILYFKDLNIPFVEDHLKLGYTEQELQWAQENESNIWRYFVENELLFDTDPKLAQRFINPAPFSKFNLELDNESPGELGRYIGWQIVRAFMENNKVSMKEMMVTDSQEIFNKSKFKPKR